MRVHRPYPEVYAFYEGRIGGVWREDADWRELAYLLGVCTYAIVSGEEALIFDTNISLAHAQFIRDTLEKEGASHIRVALSHWHVDHVAGNEVFADCEIIANRLTMQALQDNRARFAARKPSIDPLVLPNRFFEQKLALKIGDIDVELHQLDIHSHDCTVVFLPYLKLLLAGDAMEEPITWVAEPARLATHLTDLRRLANWDVSRILPSHGDEKVIATGGYGRQLVAATCSYIEKLVQLARHPERADEKLSAFMANEFATGAIAYYPPYEGVHARNVKVVMENS